MKILIILCFIALSFTLQGQQDSLRNKHNKKTRFEYKAYIVPSVFIGSGLFINTTKSRFSKQNLQQSIQRKYATQTKVDNYLPFIPIAQMYGGKMMGLQSKNNYFNQTKNLFFAQLFTSIITHGLKRATNLTRPNGAKYTFPSGHTSFSFSSASVLFYEYKETNLAYASSGFLSSGATGLLRLSNNKHWVPDVLVGAGIAILVTHLVYHFEPLKNWNPFEKRKQRKQHRNYVPVY